MYPLNLPQPYPFDQWWACAYGSEIGRQLFQRTILGQPVVLYRTEAGEPVALHGLCPHRLYPLVKGRLEGDAIQCGYPRRRSGGASPVRDIGNRKESTRRASWQGDPHQSALPIPRVGLSRNCSA
jgi:phenylpropionate dioxygenase-like ring-hydroxylating dioxygenase large terminal subunit